VRQVQHPAQPGLPGPRSHPGRLIRPQRRQRAQVVTEARPSKSEDIAYRQRRYLIMMGIRAVCFIVAVVAYVNHAGWLTAIPAVGAIVIPYFAVVFANGGREPTSTQGFRPYQPNLPAPYVPPGQGADRPPPSAAANPQSPGAGWTDPPTPGAHGAPPHNA
jgi:hypothetical protein